jgi:capsular exopolysaccharide synthesis family protein
MRLNRGADLIQQDEVDLRSVFRIMAKRKFVIILGILGAMALGAVLVFFILEPEYEAKVLLRVNNAPLGTETRVAAKDVEGSLLSQLPRMSMETHVGQLRSEALLRRVTASFPSHNVREMFETSGIAVVNGSNLISLKVRCSDPVLAMGFANAISEQYIDFVSDMSRKEIERAIQYLEELQAITKNELLATLTKLNEIRENTEMPKPEREAHIEYLDAETLRLRTTLDVLTEQILKTKVSGSINLGEASVVIVSAATLPENPVNPNKALYLAVAFILGLTFSIPLALALEHLDNRVSTAEDIEKHLALPVLGEFPQTPQKNLLLSNQKLGSVLAEAFRTFRTNLSYSNPGSSCHSILVTSPEPNDGKSFIAANLAYVLVKASYKVLLVDCDLRKPSLHQIFGLDNSRGLVNILQNGGKVMECAVLVEDGPFVLTSGPIPQNPAEIIMLNETKRFWSQQLKLFDYVIIDSPPVLAVTDAILLSTQVDGVILALSCGTTRVNTARKAKERLSKVKACIIGAVVNKVRTRRNDYFYYG